MSKRILVADDEPFVLRSIEYTLSRAGYDVLTAVDGEEALSKILAENPDLVFLDIQMPRMDGNEVCKKLREDPSRKDLYIIVITAKGQESLKDDEKMFLNSAQKAMSMRRLFIELIDPKQLVRFLSDGTRGQFEMAQEIIRTKTHEIPPKELEYLLKEYMLNLERQLEWANRALGEIKPMVDVKAKRK